jgi:hypothetical protein
MSSLSFVLLGSAEFDRFRADSVITVTTTLSIPLAVNDNILGANDSITVVLVIAGCIILVELMAVGKVVSPIGCIGTGTDKLEIGLGHARVDRDIFVLSSNPSDGVYGTEASVPYTHVVV